MSKFIKININDNVAVATENIKAGYQENELDIFEDIPFGHKVATKDISKGEYIIKYGYVIGIASKDIKSGYHVHTHNIKSNINNEELHYNFNVTTLENKKSADLFFYGYERANGDVGIRNDIWIIPTVGCVNNICKHIKNEYLNVDDSFCIKVLEHPYGCSQMGDDLEWTTKLLCSISKNPNAAGVLFVSLGCENNNFSHVMNNLGDINKYNFEFLKCQDVDDELSAGIIKVSKLAKNINTIRTKQSLSKLKVGFKCGGSDAFSGITANPLCGLISNYICNYGGASVLTEVPEMFGAEQILSNRCINEEIFKKFNSMISNYKNYFTMHNQVMYDNPSPGNKEGGISTLDEKSLGCVQKGGTTAICDILDYADIIKTNGLNLLYGPGNDIVSITNLISSGCQVVLFTSGRGTPLSGIVPTIKIATNNKIYNKKQNWFDFSADFLKNGNIKDKEKELLNLLLEVCGGKKTVAENNNFYDFAIFKNGVTM